MLVGAFAKTSVVLKAARRVDFLVTEERAAPAAAGPERAQSSASGPSASATDARAGPATDGLNQMWTDEDVAWRNVERRRGGYNWYGAGAEPMLARGGKRTDPNTRVDRAKIYAAHAQSIRSR